MYYCNNCGGTLVGPAKQCPNCRGSLVARSERTWRFMLAVGGACAGFALGAHLGISGWWWLGLVLGAVVGLLFAVAGGKLIRRARAG